MNELDFIICLFPIVFMIHEFEEIIGFKPWIAKNGSWMANRYPPMMKLVTYLQQLSVPAFALAVLEEFIVVSVVTVLALTLQWYSVWITAFTGFSLHVLFHIGQWIALRKYIPVVITSILSLPYIIWTLNKIFSEFSVNMIIVCFIIGTIVLILNLRFVHYLAQYYNKKIEV